MPFFSSKQFKREHAFAIRQDGAKLGKLARIQPDDWLDQISGTKETIGKNFDANKIIKIGAAMALLISVLLCRAAFLQIVKGSYYRELAEGNRIREQRIESKRGIIYDRKFRVLAGNSANFLLYFVPADLPKRNSEKLEIINGAVGDSGNIHAKEISDALLKIEPGSLESFQPFFAADNLDYEKAMLLYVESGDMPGVVITNKTKREYNLHSLSLSHILGYTGKINKKELAKFGSEYLPIDYIGKSGIEYFWENEMKGANGKKQIEVDAMGKEKKIINQQIGEDGHNLVLSVDIELQKKVEESLSGILRKNRLNKACAIVLDPNNGEIFAMVSLPSYNNNDFAGKMTKEQYEKIAGHPDMPLFNRCVSGEYPSGSTIKPVIAAAALEEGIINENTSFLSVGGIKIGQWFFPDWKAEGHGSTNVRRALAESVNTFFYYIGGGYNDFQGLGLERIVKYEKLFGLSSQTGVDISGESNGFLPTEEWKQKTKGEQWYIGDTYHLAIGQGDILVTPLQVANYTAVFANRGFLPRPHFARQILNSKDELISKADDNIVKSGFISSKNIDIVRQGMRQAVTSGSARGLLSLPVAAAGKTGTAQWAANKPAHAWFTGFAPYSNPEIVVTILIENGGEGSLTAVPIANEIFAWYFRNKN